MNTMNRCFSKRRLSALTLGLALACANAWSQVRQFPANSQLGWLEVTTPPLAKLNNHPDRLSPGARIKASNNLIVMPASIVGQQQWVRFVRNQQGQLHDVWILSPAEVEAQRDSLPTVTNFVFGSELNQTPVDDGKTPFHQLPTYPQR
jgi:hypothetical protein